MLAALTHADGQTDMTKEVGASCDYANTPENFYYCVFQQVLFTTYASGRLCWRHLQCHVHSRALSWPSVFIALHWFVYCFSNLALYIAC